jgi:D-alanyl-D-alanine carboxypeptidase (penicillin-binding protein 5/6)
VNLDHSPSKSLYALLLVTLISIARLAGADQPLIPAPPAVATKSHLLEDFHSRKVIAESNADLRVEPASLTKIMTAYVVFRELAKGNLKLDDPVTISEKAWRTGGSRSFLEVNAQIPLETLLKGMIVQSGNDASVALAEHVAGDESVFVQMMNQNAQRLGLTSTHFMNSMGLPDPNHYTTARDLAALTRALIEDFPEYYAWHAIKEFDYNRIKQSNRNRLLWRDPSVDGVKTGHTETAGYCLVASAVRDGMRLISVVMGSKSENERANVSTALLNYGFRFFETRPIYKANEKLADVRVWKGDPNSLPAGLSRDFYATAPRGQYANLKASVETDGLVTAPVAQGSKVGLVKVTLGDVVVAQGDLVALKAAAEGGIVRRLFDQVQLYFK